MARKPICATNPVTLRMAGYAFDNGRHRWTSVAYTEGFLVDKDGDVDDVYAKTVRRLEVNVKFFGGFDWSYADVARGLAEKVTECTYLRQLHLDLRAFSYAWDGLEEAILSKLQDWERMKMVKVTVVRRDYGEE